MGRVPKEPGTRLLLLAVHHKRRRRLRASPLCELPHTSCPWRIFMATWIVIAASNCLLAKGRFVASSCLNDTRLPNPTQSDIATAASQATGHKKLFVADVGRRNLNAAP